MPVRKMPQNLEAEMSVLGVAFLNKNALVKICEELYSDMFYSDANKKLFEAIKISTASRYSLKWIPSLYNCYDYIEGAKIVIPSIYEIKTTIQMHF